MFIQPISLDTDTLNKLTLLLECTHTQSLTHMHVHIHTHTNRVLCKQTLGLSVLVPRESVGGRGLEGECISLYNQSRAEVLSLYSGVKLEILNANKFSSESITNARLQVKTFKSISAPLPYQDQHITYTLDGLSYEKLNKQFLTNQFMNSSASVHELCGREKESGKKSVKTLGI